ncbi:hypothetical protein BU16DRAFT_554535 [Lophium mytilinum]|uniref:Uncharacterized protein n=1 Tax=Lophium mytilinum TaxID=390894 RepID=A0A6A6RFF5_9PEZI|nr:hypothetical protein BU16DRAFT_554535 [Lophium mytilinum]
MQRCQCEHEAPGTANGRPCLVWNAVAEAGRKRSMQGSSEVTSVVWHEAGRKERQIKGAWGPWPGGERRKKRTKERRAVEELRGTVEEVAETAEGVQDPRRLHGARADLLATERRSFTAAIPDAAAAMPHPPASIPNIPAQGPLGSAGNRPPDALAITPASTGHSTPSLLASHRLASPSAWSLLRYSPLRCQLLPGPSWLEPAESETQAMDAIDPSWRLFVQRACITGPFFMRSTCPKHPTSPVSLHQNATLPSFLNPIRPGLRLRPMHLSRPII